MTAIPFPVGKGEGEVHENNDREERRADVRGRRRDDDQFIEYAGAADRGLAVARNFITAIVLLIGFGVTIGVEIANSHSTAKAITEFQHRLENLSNQVTNGDHARELAVQDEKNRSAGLSQRMDRAENDIGTLTKAYSYNLNWRLSVVEGRLGITPRPAALPNGQPVTQQP